MFIGGMIGLALTSNLLVMYIFWEIIGFCSYSLIAYYYRDPAAVPGGTKAFIVTRIGDIGFLTGIIILWHSTGTLDVFEIIDCARAGSIPSNLLTMAGFGFIAGAVGKSAIGPLDAAKVGDDAVGGVAQRPTGPPLPEGAPPRGPEHVFPQTHQADSLD